MSLRLINPKQVPKDGYIFVEPTNGRRFGGMFSFNYVRNLVLAYRTGNNLPGATIDQVSQELDCQTCKHDPRLCYDSDIRVDAQVRQTSGCGSCGVVTK